jgi:hypothetical protein
MGLKDPNRKDEDCVRRVAPVTELFENAKHSDFGVTDKDVEAALGFAAQAKQVRGVQDRANALMRKLMQSYIPNSRK